MGLLRRVHFEIPCLRPAFQDKDSSKCHMMDRNLMAKGKMVMTSNTPTPSRMALVITRIISIPLIKMDQVNRGWVLMEPLR